ncbi:MAG: sugar phosphate isomerase/epimerase family protein [Pirellulaceae bacterium]
MYLGYNTNGLAHHDPFQAIEIVAETGYRAIAITLDHQWLNPYSSEIRKQLPRFREHLERNGLKVIIETGARFLLEPRKKHWPPLTDSPEIANLRVDFIARACMIAEELGAPVVSIWSGSADENQSQQSALDNLATNLTEALKAAEQHNVTLGFEPEPGMMIDTLAAFFRLKQWIEHPRLKLTVDIGHLFCQGELPIVDKLNEWQEEIVNVHIEDMRSHVHEHLMFGDGEIYFPPIFDALKQMQYAGPVCVELSRHSHDAVNAVRKSFSFLNQLV